MNRIRIDLNENLAPVSQLNIQEVLTSNSLAANGVKQYVIGDAYNKVYGTGERFDDAQQKGYVRNIHVVEKFCNQGDITYCPVPFFFTDTGFGVYVETFVTVEIIFSKNIIINVPVSSEGKYPVMYLLFGTPIEMINAYYELTSFPLLPPKWSFGIWMSANRWKSQKTIEEQVALLEQNEMDASVVVIEAWGDEATFYIWRENAWENAEDCVNALHEKGIKFIMWQIPVLKKLEEGRSNLTHENDCAEAVKNRYCVMQDDKPYIIPDGHWFSGSMLLDFTNPNAREWWFKKRRHLLDIGVDGFKTDGGEMIYSDNVNVYDGRTGIEMKNGYINSYIKAYTDFVGPSRVLFSRAGYSGQQAFPLQWAGDQQSTWEEFRHIIIAGISAGLSGIPFWGFDIAGFAGPVPSISLYERATQTSVFAPIMQWHSEPEGGQFKALMLGSGGVNDRSPWNIAAIYNEPDLIKCLRFQYNLRYNLLPYIYDCAVKASKGGMPLMKHLVLEYPDDIKAQDVNDCFMLGDILVVPVFSPEEKIRNNVYFPQGTWTSLWNGETFEGSKMYSIPLVNDRTPAFVRDGGCLALNLNEGKKLGGRVGNNMNGYSNLYFCPFGPVGSYDFSDDLGNEIRISWKDNSYSSELIKGSQQFSVLPSLW